MDNIKMINGECLDELKKLDKDSVDLVFCDLPYGQTACKWDCKIDLDLLWTELKRVGKERTPYFFTCTTKFGHSLITSNKKWFRYDVVWIKSNKAGFLNCYKMPMRQHEMIYVFYKKLPLYKAKQIHQGLEEPPPSTDLEIQNSNHKRINATQKPIKLLEWILKYYTNEGDVVLDPTFGSGTTAIACDIMKRKFIGFEKDKEQFEKALLRLDNLRNPKPDIIKKKRKKKKKETIVNV